LAVLPGCNDGCLHHICSWEPGLREMQNVFSLMALELRDFLSFLRGRVSCDARVARWSGSLDEITACRHHGRSSFLSSFFLLQPSLSSVAVEFRARAAVACSRTPVERLPVRARVVAETRARVAAESHTCTPAEWRPVRALHYRKQALHREPEPSPRAKIPALGMGALCREH
jgi:hypothetical protein